MDTPRKTKLYNQLAKDYTPKQADMMICKYIEGLEARIAALESTTPGNVPMDDETVKVLEVRVAALETEVSTFLASLPAGADPEGGKKKSSTTSSDHK